LTGKTFNGQRREGNEKMRNESNEGRTDPLSFLVLFGKKIFFSETRHYSTRSAISTFVSVYCVVPRHAKEKDRNAPQELAFAERGTAFYDLTKKRGGVTWERRVQDSIILKMRRSIEGNAVRAARILIEASHTRDSQK
jgi:hypothetical protein